MSKSLEFHYGLATKQGEFQTDMDQKNPNIESRTGP